MRRWLLALATLSLLVGISSWLSPASAWTLSAVRGTVLEVKDGDSLVVSLDSGPIEVRMHAADAPEYDQPGGREAQAALRRRLPRGSVVMLEPVEQDQYSRMVATVYAGEQNVGQWAVQQGNAWAYRYYTHDAVYCEREDEARRAQRGVWALPAAQRIAPWEWRARKRDPMHRIRDYSGETLERCLAALEGSGRASVSSPRREGSSAPVNMDHAPAGVGSIAREAEPVAPSGACRIKGNIGSGGRKVYHLPGSASYDATRIDPSKGERWFCSAAEAERDGWHAP